MRLVVVIKVEGVAVLVAVGLGQFTAGRYFKATTRRLETITSIEVVLDIINAIIIVVACVIYYTFTISGCDFLRR